MCNRKGMTFQDLWAIDVLTFDGFMPLMHTYTGTKI